MASQTATSQPPNESTEQGDGNDETPSSAEDGGTQDAAETVVDSLNSGTRSQVPPSEMTPEAAADGTEAAASTEAAGSACQTSDAADLDRLGTDDDDEDGAADALMRDENAAACYRALKEDFRGVLENLPRDAALEPFRQQYEKLYEALVKSHASEWSLLKRCRRLTKQIQENSTKVVAALKITYEDQSLIDILRKEVQHAWQLVQAGKEREELSRQTIAGLRKNIEELSKAIEASESEHLVQEAKLEEHLLERDRLVKECEELTAKNTQIATSNANLSEKLKDLERRAAEPQEELTQTKELLRIKRAEAQHEQRRREKLEKDMAELRRLIEQKQQEIHAKQATIEQQNKRADHLQSVVAGLHRENEEETKKIAEITGRIAETETRLNEQIFKNSKIQAANFAREAELRDQEEEINRLHTEKERVVKMHDLLRKKLSQVEDEKKSLEDHRNTLKSEIMAVEREIESLKQQAEADKRSIDSLMRERDLLSKTALKSEDAAKKQDDVLKRHEAHAIQLQREIQRYRAEVDSQQARIKELELHRDKSGQELSRANEKYLSLLEDIRAGDNRVADLQRSIGELRAKLATQKTLYESVRADRNLYSRNLIESLDEISEMKQKFKLLYHQIEQLKEEVKQKDASLIKGHFEQQKIVKDNEKISSDLQSAQHKLTSLQQIVLTQRREIKKLETTIQDAETERSNQRKEFELILTERDMLGTQLLKRKQELTLLYEKIKIQQSTLEKGEAQYRARLNGISLLRKKVNAARRELGSVRSQVANVDELKREVYRLQKELLQERTKVKALSESLENPMNVHRWRRLEGSDPSKLEMVNKIQTLQKRLIAKTEEVVERDIMIQEKEKLYFDLKTQLSKYPGPEVIEQMQNYQQTLKEKAKQLLAMSSELTLYRRQVCLHKDEIGRLNRELAHIKGSYVERRRKTLQTQGKSSESASASSSGPVDGAACLHVSKTGIPSPSGPREATELTSANSTSGGSAALPRQQQQNQAPHPRAEGSTLKTES